MLRYAASSGNFAVYLAFEEVIMADVICVIDDVDFAAFIGDTFICLEMPRAAIITGGGLRDDSRDDDKDGMKSGAVGKMSAGAKHF